MLRILLCERHATATPFDTEPLKPAPPVSLVCPLCIAARNDGEHEGGDGTETPASRIVGKNVVDDTPMTPRVAAKLDEVRVRMMDEGRMPPLREAEIIDEMTWASREAEALDHAPKGARHRRARTNELWIDGELRQYSGSRA